MKRRYDPLPAKRKPFASPVLLVAGSAGLEAWTEDGTLIAHGPAEGRGLLQSLRGCRVFSATKLNRLAAALDARYFTGTLWRRQLIGLRLDDGPRVLGSRGVLGTVPPPEAYAGLLLADTFCRDHRVRLGSPGWTAEQFWRGTLPSPIRVGSPTGKRGMMGARKDCPNAPIVRGDSFYVDLHAAYPAAMMGEAVPLVLRPSSGRGLDAPVGVARARVTVPEWSAPWPPIPEAMPFGIWWRTGQVEGWWPLCELRLARDYGCRVEVDAVFEGDGYCDLFGEWGRKMLEGRLLPGTAGRWMKMVGNALWGTFAMDGEVREVRFADEQGSRVERVVRVRQTPPPTAGFVAGEVSARVRVRLYRELIAPFRPWYVDTDGGVIPAGAGMPEPCGDGPGEWSAKESFSKFEARAAQAYRGTDHRGRSRTVIAGVEGATFADFDRYAPEGIQSWRVERVVPGVLDENGEPVPILPRRGGYAGLPPGWTAIDPDGELVAQIAGLSGTVRR